MQHLVEKRRYNRFEFQKSVQIFPVFPSKSGHIYEVQNNSIDAWANDISNAGVRLEVAYCFDRYFLLKLNFEFGKSQPVEAYGRIIWSYDNHSGIQFLLMDQLLRQGIKAFSEKRNN